MSATSSKKSLANIRTASGAPVLVSPIAVAHRNHDGSDKKSDQNHVRAQWIANLKKKSMASDELLQSGELPLEKQQTLGALLETDFRGVKVEPKTTIDMMSKKWIKPLLKKRNNLLDIHNAPKPRTPRRKLNCGNAFEDMHIQTSLVESSPWANFSGVGTPSSHHHNHHHHHHHTPQTPHDVFGQDMDFGSFDTFLDLPTPKAGTPFEMMDAPSGLEPFQMPPTLVRTTSIEQEGLSQCFEQTHLSQRAPDVEEHVPSDASTDVSSGSPSHDEEGCIFDHSKHPELLFDFNDADIDKEVDNFYMDDQGNELEIDLIA
ncbi:hypothetical protein AC1031_001363 [Aphanomyces cochlioides]|nr:hypothetical protein AC1031_001363 [Aphanomyces cochlioides]